MKSFPLFTASIVLVGLTGCLPTNQTSATNAGYNAPNRYGYRGSVTDPSGVVGQPSAAPDGAIAQALAPQSPSGTLNTQANPTQPPAGSTGAAVTAPILPTVNSTPPRPPDTGINPQQSSAPTVPPPPPTVSQTGTTSTTPKPPEPPSTTKAKDDYPYGIPVPGKDGMVYSPYDKEAGYVDVRGMKPGALVEDPYSKKLFRVP